MNGWYNNAMKKYVALLRGIGPLNPSMKNEHLRRVVEQLGYSDVQTVISSGNVVFTAHDIDIRETEKQLEAAWQRELGFTSATIIYSQRQLENLATQQLFGDTADEQESRQHVTFVQILPPSLPMIPHEGKLGGYTVMGIYGRAVCVVIDSTRKNVPEYTLWVEKYFGKAITTRSWRTVLRILKKMG